ncbi:MAG: hypothetical protein K0S65_5232, partial [Labilithrix sp.]|nr:hypothetical protein [Labilithrix sp.]
MKPSLALRFLPAALATGVVGLVVATRPLSAVPRAVALAFVVGSWAAPVLFQRKDVRGHASVVAAIGAATAAGQVNAGLPYGVACVVLLLACVVSLRVARAATSEKPLSSLRPGIILLATAAGITSGLVFGLPRLAERIERRLEAMFGGDGDQATAFSTTMVLGSTR